MPNLVFVCAGVLVLAPLGAQAQSTERDPLRFEVAAVKGGAVPRSRQAVFITRGRVRYLAQTLQELLWRAYEIRPDQVNGPGWTRTDRFDVEATMAPDTPKGQIPLMLQALLAERFHLKFHRETKLVASWVLSVTDSGSQLPAVESDEDTLKGWTSEAGRGITGKGPVSSLRWLLNGMLGEAVVDATGLKGTYDIDLRWQDTPRAPTPATGAEADSTAIPAASFPSGSRYTPELRKALERYGLRLDWRKVPTDIYIIDSADREPAEN